MVKPEKESSADPREVTPLGQTREGEFGGSTGGRGLPSRVCLLALSQADYGYQKRGPTD